MNDKFKYKNILNAYKTTPPMINKYTSINFNQSSRNQNNSSLGQPPNTVELSQIPDENHKQYNSFYNFLKINNSKSSFNISNLKHLDDQNNISE